MFSIACVQLNSGEDLADNLRQIDALCHRAAASAPFVLLPENALLMRDPGGKQPLPAYTEAEHPGIVHCRNLAKSLGIWLLLGSVSVASPDPGKRFNRSLLIDDQGEIAARYDKIHLFDVDLGGGERYEESARIAPGNEACLAATPWGKLGMSVCYDVRFPQLYRRLAQAGAEFLAMPAAFTAKTGAAHWHILLRARAIETGCFVFAPAQCGVHPGGRETFGHALIIDPWGRILAEAGAEPGIITASIDPALVAQTRRGLPSLEHDREFHLAAATR